MNLDSRILVTGANGMLGRALLKRLNSEGFFRINAPSRNVLNLLDEDKVDEYVRAQMPDYVFHLASRVYGLKGNLNNQLLSLHENTKIYANLLNALSKIKTVKKIFFAGTVASYSYPYKSQILKEEDFFLGNPHRGEFGYAMAKRHAYAFLEILRDNYGIDSCYGLFTNLYGENDTFDAINGHVIPALIYKAVEAKKNNFNTFKVWGNASTVRDFLYIEDAAAAAIHCMKNISGIINLSSGIGTSMGELARIIAENVGGVEPEWDNSEPIGISKRIVSADKLVKSGYSEFNPLGIGICKTVKWYLGADQ